MASTFTAEFAKVGAMDQMYGARRAQSASIDEPHRPT